MSCHGCAEKYGFMKKEYGCPKCGFSYCKKCLRFQMIDPKTNKSQQICTKCHQMASATKEPVAVLNAIQRLESMDDPAKPPIVLYKQHGRKVGLKELRKGLSLEDQNILERLESLRKDDDGISNVAGSSKGRNSDKIEEEIAERLAKLKGEDYNPEANKRSAFLKNTKPETEEDIIAKFAAEVEMDDKYAASVTSDIEERLAGLKGERQSSTNAPSTSSGVTGVADEDELTEEDQVKLILKKLQDELALEEKVGGAAGVSEMDIDQPEPDENIQPVESDEDIDVEDLCGICSEKRATLICKECDDDIYCKACFHELHRELGETHSPKALKKK